MASIQESVNKLVFASSCAVYPLHPNKALTENMATMGVTPYAISKIAGEQIITFYGQNNNLNACSLRCFNIYGEGQRADSQYAAVIPKFIKSAIIGEKIYLFGSGHQTRDFIHIDDVVDAYILAARSDFKGSLNVGTGCTISVHKLGKLITSYENKSHCVDAPGLTGDASNSCADLTLINNKLKFVPKISIENGLSSLYQTFKLKEGL
jgi:UDP-glucose 4-epimerase